jgi:hypothetical protein
MTIAERVADGAAWLDYQAPGWEHKVDLDALQMSSCSRCILGQVFDQGTGIAGFNFAEQYFNDDGEMAAFGFDLDDYDHETWSDGENPWEPLADAWTDLLKQRFDSGFLSGE